jgi:hypothetical protein
MSVAFVGFKTTEDVERATEVRLSRKCKDVGINAISNVVK